jgi:hypothetical protein
MSDSYPAEWLDNNEPPWPPVLDPMDPRHPDFLDPWRPTSAESALVKGLTHDYCSGTPEFNAAFLYFGRDRYHQRSWPEAFLALLEVLKQHAVGSVGRELTLARLREDVKVARKAALEEMQQ